MGPDGPALAVCLYFGCSRGIDCGNKMSVFAITGNITGAHKIFTASVLKCSNAESSDT